MDKEKETGGEAIYGCSVLEVERGTEVSPDLISKKITSQQEAETRFKSINGILCDAKNLPSKVRACLEVEVIWLRFRLGLVNKDERKDLLDGFLDSLKEDDLATYNFLLCPNGDEITPLVRIRDNVMPQTTIKGHIRRTR